MINDILLFCVSLITIKDETMFIFISYVIKTLKNLLLTCRNCVLLGNLNIALYVINIVLIFHLSFNLMDFFYIVYI